MEKPRPTTRAEVLQAELEQKIAEATELGQAIDRDKCESSTSLPLGFWKNWKK